MNKGKEIHTQPAKKHVTAIIAAAGSSRRMNTDQSKQLIELCGKPVIAWTLEAFEQAELVDDVIVVCRQEDMINIYDITAYFGFDKVRTVITGGETRQQSVLKGINCVNENTGFLAIHDGARPLISPDDINKVIKAAFAVKAAVLGVPVKDTIKFTYPSGIIKSTPDRSNIWQVQTPQVFDKNLYFEAIKHPANLGKDLTDDCQLAENAGIPVMMCEGNYSNMKITTQEDLYIAQNLIEESCLD